MNGGSRTLHAPALSLQQIVDGNPTFGVENPKCHRLALASTHGDWSSRGLILICSPMKCPIVVVCRGPSHMHLATNSPPILHYGDLCISPALALSKTESRFLLVDRFFLYQGFLPLIRTLPGANLCIRFSSGLTVCTLIIMWHVSHAERSSHFCMKSPITSPAVIDQGAKINSGLLQALPLIDMMH